MKFYFDDSGSYSVTEPAPHVMLGVLIPDTREADFLTFHSEFVTNLDPGEFQDGEPKGSKLTDKSRTKLFRYLADNPWIRIAVSVSDSEFNNQQQIQGYRDEQVKLYEADFNNGLANNAPEDVVKLQLDLLNATKGGISDVQFIKGFLLFHNLYALLHNSIQVYQGAEYDTCWFTFKIVFDRQDKNVITPLEKWINREFMHFIQEHSEPFIVPEPWVVREHPFIKTFRDGSNNRLVLNKIFKDGFKFEESKEVPGLQYADWIANTVRQVVKRKRDASYLDIIRPNLVGHNRTPIILARFYQADMMGIHDKCKDLIY
jgi:hypothetical protein